MKLARFALLCLTFASTIVLAESNPVALINNPLVPTSAAPGGTSFTLTVNGTGFVQGSVVDWNGSTLATTFITSSQLTAVVPASDVVIAGAALITVVSPVPGGGTSNVDLFEVRQPFSAVSFGSPTSPAVGSDAGWVIAADVNADNKLDLVVTDYTDFGVSILLGNGDGTFQPQM